MHFDEEMGFQYLGLGITVLSPSDPRPPTVGVGDPRRRWLVDSGATCHIIAERWLSNYKIVYRYEVGIPVLKGAGDNVLPTRGMVDLECKVGQTKVVMRKVVICALDINVLSSYSLHEQG